MQPTPIDIEQIIRVVMQRLAAADDLMSGVGAVAETQDIDSELVLRERVITLAALEGKLKGKRRVRVHPRAVVTPAVTDELKRHKIELVREASVTKSTIAIAAQPSATTPTSTPTPTPTRTTAPVLVCGSAIWFNSLPRHLCPQQAIVTGCEDRTAIDLIKQHRERGGTRAVWLSATPFAANVAIARSACCSAVMLSSLGDVAAALAQADPDCVIVDPARFTVAAIGNLVKTLAKHSRSSAVKT